MSGPADKAEAEARNADLKRAHRAVSDAVRGLGRVHMGATVGALMDVLVQVAQQAGVSRAQLHEVMHGALDRYVCPCPECKAGGMVKGGTA